MIGMRASRPSASAGARPAAVATTLFACLFAGQAALIAMSPVLAEAARDLGVSTAAAGQLRTVTGLAAGATALLLTGAGGRLGLRRQLLAGAVFLLVGSLASAAAPGFAALAAAQVPVGVGVTLLTSGGTLAAAEWAPAEQRTRVLSWALVGQPAAWIVGMPLLGAAGGVSWRLGWLVLPVGAAVAAGLLAARRRDASGAPVVAGGARAALRRPELRRWLVAELLANSAWAGTLVYAGALFSETHAVPAARTGLLLAVAAVAYVVGNLASRRLVASHARARLAAAAALMAIPVVLFGAVRPDAFTSTALLTAASLVAGGRTLLSSSLGLDVEPALRPAATALRSATMQLGYFVGSLVGGAALAVGGYTALGLAMGAGLAAATAVVAAPVRRRAPRPAPAPSRA